MLVQYAFPLAVIGLFSIWYGALNAMGSPDLKRMVAYSSVSHMGYVVLGISALTAEGLTGAVYQTVSHGLISPLLFLLTGVIYDRVQNRNRDQLNGLVKPMPVFVAFFMLAFFASMGMPGFSGFIAEILVILGAFKSSGFNQIIPRWVAILSTGGLFLSAAYFLYTARKMFFGPFQVAGNIDLSSLKDLSIREYCMVLPLLILVLLLGIMPSWLLRYINPVIDQLSMLVEGK
jgi:NADH-quinone oxidoreductase subunit M